MKQQFLVWRAGETMAARVVKGRLALAFARLALRGGTVHYCPVNALTLSGLTPQQIAQMWEEWTAQYARAR